MTTLECSRCGEVFETTREPAVPGADTSRCPACGKRHEGDEPRGEPASSDTVTVASSDESSDDTDGVTVEIHVHE